MSKSTPIEELEASIDQFYERYSSKKVALAALIVGVFSIGLSSVAYVLTGMAAAAIVTVGIVGFLSVNLALIYVIPPKKALQESRDLIMSAIREPSRIKAIDQKGVRLADGTGNVHTLNGPELEVWTQKVVPYFMQTQSARHSVGNVKSERTYTASERKYIEDLKRDVKQTEMKIEEERSKVEIERRKIESDRKEMESRIAELHELEKVASEKLSKAEVIDAEQHTKTDSEREAEFKKREEEIMALKEQLEREAKDLEERSQYISSVEDSLVDRLNELSTREAGIEQEEINAGLREG